MSGITAIEKLEILAAAAGGAGVAAGAGAGAGVEAGNGPRAGPSLPPPPHAASKAPLLPTVRSEAPSFSTWRRGGVLLSLFCSEAFDAPGARRRGVRAPRESSETDMRNQEKRLRSAQRKNPR
ncbi:hypothetical protein GmRootV15_22400 [Variovorax sp. V15]